MKPQSPVLTKERFDAVLFDLDGVLTDTMKIHSVCWKTLFDEFLRSRSERLGEEFLPFTIESDYRLYVDGKPRYDGVRDFLASREIDLPEGSSSDAPGHDTVGALGNMKDGLVTQVMDAEGVEAYEGSVALVRRLRSEGIKTAVVSSSRHCAKVLQVVGIADLFDERVDGTMIEGMNLAGKPAPDCFLEAAQRLGVTPERAAVVEDAISGVQAGCAGGFGLVIAVARKNDEEELAKCGAHLVIHDLAELLQP